MVSGRKKKIRNLFLILFSIGIIVSFLNIFLANRLERYLKGELAYRLSDATDGFYILSYDDLSIDLLNGELKIEGIRLRPDSAVFDAWSARDSLPATYFKADVGSIEFTGINLIWRLNYRQLHFQTFEIQRPEVEIFDAYYSGRSEKQSRDTASKTLYELIEPYIDVLSVRTLNLEHAGVSFLVENPFTPITYSLQDVNFHAYGFWLDSLSSKSGKLLYSDNFDFTTNRPQVLLTNNDFYLLTDSIRLNTNDSVIHIGNVQLKPQQEVWENIQQRPRNYIDGEIGKVEVNGIAFKRDNSRNFLNARSFDIQSSDIKIYDIADKNPGGESREEDKPAQDRDTVVQSLSVYDLISPVLSSVAIEEINIGQMAVDFLLNVKDSVETYKLENLDFHAYDFLVDSTSEQRRGLWYSRNFVLEANRIEGLMTARNHKLQVGRVSLDTEAEHFSIEDVRLDPISTNTRNDYLSGNIDSIVIDGLVYANGIRAENFQIESPRVTYFSTPYTHPGASGEKTDSRVDVDAILNPFLEYLSIGTIGINKASFTWNDKAYTDTTIYRISDFDFFATNFLVNRRTNEGKGLFFTCDDVGFHFSDFDNYLMDNQYRLQIKDAFFSTVEGVLRLEDVKLLPQQQLKIPDTSIRMETPLIFANGIKNPLNDLWNDLTIDSFFLKSPDIKVVKTNNPQKSKKKNKEKETQEAPMPFFNKLVINGISVTDSKLHYADGKSGTDIHLSNDYLALKSISWNKDDDKMFSINEVGIYGPQLAASNKKTFEKDTPEGKTKTIAEELNPLVERIHIGKFHISDMYYSSGSADSSKADFGFKLFTFSGLDWVLAKDSTRLHLESADILDPVIAIKPAEKAGETKKDSTSSGGKSIYDQLGQIAAEINVGRFNLINGYSDPVFLQQYTRQPLPKYNAVDFTLEGLKIDNQKQTFGLEDVALKTNGISLPVDNGFYILTIEDVDLNKGNLQLRGLRLESPYSMIDFSYNHPKHSDWFDIRADFVSLQGIDLPSYYADQILRIEKAEITDAVLENFKNQKIILPRTIVPMIYEGLQKAPLKIDINEVAVNNLEVVYKELARGGSTAGKIFFTDMNGVFHGFTNVASFPGQFIRLDANGKLMDDGYFTAVWMLPVDTLNDRFYLQAHLPSYDLTTLNQIITPLAPARVVNGSVSDLTFHIDASSLGANIQMRFLYDKLKADLLKEKDGEMVKNKFLTFLVNLVVRENNPRWAKQDPKVVDIDIVRNPYHSTFNYLWQNLRPAVAESVGISHGMQKFAAGVMNVFSKIKNFFGFGKSEEEKIEELQKESDLPVIVVE